MSPHEIDGDDQFCMKHHWTLGFTLMKLEKKTSRLVSIDLSIYRSIDRSQIESHSSMNVWKDVFLHSCLTEIISSLESWCSDHLGRQTLIQARNHERVMTQVNLVKQRKSVMGLISQKQQKTVRKKSSKTLRCRECRTMLRSGIVPSIYTVSTYICSPPQG